MSDGTPDEHPSVGKSISKWFTKLKKGSQEEVEEDILTMVNEGQETGAIEDDEAEMISNIFELNDKEARDIMTHRSQVDGIEVSSTLEEAIDFILCQTHSRFPVYDKTIDHIVGILHLKDCFTVSRDDENLQRPLKEIDGLVRDAFFITETKKLNALFREMQTTKTQMAIVIDEYGQMAGVVAMEDILEEIVGNIQDEYDDDETLIEEKGEDRFEIDGMTKLEDLSERFGIDFEEDKFETINGYLISRLDRVPEEDDQSKINVGEYTFRILEVKHHKIEKVLVYKEQDEQIQNEDRKD
ncbi:MAG: hemolysin family protein [Lachnospiraceae bacterium]|nr:hemolysin family protein [Lachnospiraceae bacterium]